MKPWNWNRLIARFLDVKRQAGWGPGTVEAAARWLKKFLLWCNEHGLMAPAAVTAEHVEQYRQTLLCTRTASSRFYSLCSVDQALRTLRHFFHWATSHQHLLFNPTHNLVLPRIHTRQVARSIEEVEKIMRSAEGGGAAVGLRDRALLEVLYRAGARRREALRLTVADLDLAARQLHVTGHNGRRTVRIDAELAGVLERYLHTARPLLLGNAVHDALFVSAAGTPYTTHALGQRLKRLSRRVGFSVTTPMLRQACAVHRIEAGADFDDVAQMLGLRHRSAAAYASIATAALRRRSRQGQRPQERRNLTHFLSLTVPDVDEP